MIGPLSVWKGSKPTCVRRIYCVSRTQLTRDDRCGHWTYQNDFSTDPNLQRGRTEGMLLQRSLDDEPFLRYLRESRRARRVLPTPADRQQKQMRTVQGYTGYHDVVTTYRNEWNPAPTFLMMVSGRFERNRRPWCPYCRYSELPLEYTFYVYTPQPARMIRVEVPPTYAAWRTAHAFRTDPHLHLHFVPLLFSMHQVGGGRNGTTPSIQLVPHKVR
ncbi:hypothetical protein PsorP6_000601 [Peronosclerospora sorghi]|uniref:Uncharacterized protein n=1 Tax=Peronosclerospora sorghi TaxID=230839 RepID=A0ACC0WUR9_9STRA|nr:hypothetical protein PsorP6_000601 [Peronosclerospora sorghi]